ncbi:hypothetical protein GLYMA_18G073650v4 [Glycine max]|nr:hypothetical protein GLYMA_18G073650v4 [Glycine max]KAH1153638.1 hypothetical protein GYH30_049326 [Glycine max]
MKKMAILIRIPMLFSFFIQMEEVPEESDGEVKCTWRRGIRLIKKRFNNVQDLVTLSGGLYFKE